MRKIFYAIITLLFITLSGFLLFEKSLFSMFYEPETEKKSERKAPPFLTEKNKKWADSLMKTMTLDEKIGQLFMVAAYSNKDLAHQQEIENLITKYHIGGLIFFQGTPYKQAVMTNEFQKKSKLPLMIGIDGEWGLAMRLDSTIKYPKQMTLGAIQDNRLIYKMGNNIAEESKRLGIHVNFAPVADVNNNPANPVINYRSFGENKYKVTEKSLAYMNGMQDKGVLANGKHFPGHGDTDADSHKTLPIIKHDVARLDSIELYPFKHLIDSGLGSMMVAHLYIPSLDDTPNKASTLSKKIVSDLLKYDLNFEGLIFTDALNMRGVSAFYDPGQLEIAALLAGNDVLLFSEDVPKAIESIKKAIEEKVISEKDINEKCLKILMTKKWMKLDKKPKVSLAKLHQDLNKRSAKYLNQVLFENALTIIQNENDILPITDLKNKKIATVNIGAPKENTFSNTADLYCTMGKFNTDRELNFNRILSLVDSLRNYNTVIVSLFDMSQRPHQNFGFSKSADDFIFELAKDSTKNIILNVMGNPYCLENSRGALRAKAIIVNYEEREETESLSAQLIFGGIQSKGKLPVSIDNKWQEGHGIETRSPIRFKYTMPEELGMIEEDLKTIDSIVYQGLKDTIFPGCQIFAAKDGKVFYHKSFGNHTYDTKSKQVALDDIYDLASITKIASSTAAMMKLQSEGKVNVDSTLGTYLKDKVDTTEYNKMVLKEMLAHQAGLKAWIPFYMRTLDKGVPKKELYNSTPTDFYDSRVAENLYIHSGIRDSIFNRIITTDVNSRKKYLYSDLAYYFVNEIILRKTNKTQDQYVYESFYKPLGLDNIGYKPREKWDVSRIPPTEDDKSFRHQIIHADVHDQGAAMLGGVCGHAGLFANSNDLAVMMQTFMQYGTYGGERYFDEEVVKLFTSSPYYSVNRNRRGIGFDKPVRGGGNGPTCSGCASDNSFGHSGFTGTLTWADPDNGMVFVFLSNRTFPDAENKKIITSGIRTRIMQEFYNAIKSGDERLKKKKI